MGQRRGRRALGDPALAVDLDQEPGHRRHLPDLFSGEIQRHRFQPRQRAVGFPGQSQWAVRSQLHDRAVRSRPGDGPPRLSLGEEPAGAAVDRSGHRHRAGSRAPHGNGLAMMRYQTSLLVTARLARAALAAAALLMSLLLGGCATSATPPPSDTTQFGNSYNYLPVNDVP